MSISKYIRLQGLDKILAVSSVIFNQSCDKVLLVKEYKRPHLDAWGPPGGKVELRDADYKVATQREVLEETGYNINVGKPIEIVTLPQFLIICSLGEIYGEKVEPLTGEIMDWWDIQLLQQQIENEPNLFIPNLKPIVDKALRIKRLR